MTHLPVGRFGAEVDYHLTGRRPAPRWRAARGRTHRQIRSLVLSVDLVDARPIWPAHIGRVVDPDGSRRIPSDRLDDQPDDQAGRPVLTSITNDSFRGLVSSLPVQPAHAGRP